MALDPYRTPPVLPPSNYVQPSPNSPVSWGNGPAQTPLAPAPVTPDPQNPWFKSPGAGALPPTPGAPGQPGASQTPNLFSLLDPKKWESWTDDQWRLATGGYDPNEAAFQGALRQAMGYDNDPQMAKRYHNILQSYGPGGQKYFPGGINPLNGQMNYAQPGNSMANINQALQNANNAPLYSGGLYSNPGWNPAYSVTFGPHNAAGPGQGYTPPPVNPNAPPAPPPIGGNPIAMPKNPVGLNKTPVTPVIPQVNVPGSTPQARVQGQVGVAPTSMGNLFRSNTYRG